MCAFMDKAKKPLWRKVCAGAGIGMIACYIAGMVLMLAGQFSLGMMLWVISTVGGIGILYYGKQKRKRAEEARRAKEQATLEADVIVKAETRKKELELAAEAEAEQIRRKAKGEADAIYAKMEAEARGMEEILRKQAAGFAEIVKAAGGDADAALKLLIADKLEDLMRVQVDAIKNIKIDKVTVWDGGQGGDGKTSTANFISGMMKSVPPLQEVFGMAGMSLPSILGKKVEEGAQATDAPEITLCDEDETEA